MLRIPWGRIDTCHNLKRSESDYYIYLHKSNALRITRIGFWMTEKQPENKIDLQMGLFWLIKSVL